MARNGSGTYSLPAGNPVTTGSTISSSWANTTLSDIASALTGSIAADGQTTPTANLLMGTYAHTNVGNATARTMYASAGQVQDSTLTYLTSVSGTNAITASAPIVMTAYAAGQTFRFIAANATTGAVTININSIGLKSIVRTDGSALVSGDIASGAAVQIMYDGTNFQLLSDANGKSETVTNLTVTGTTTAAGLITANGGITVNTGTFGPATFTTNSVDGLAIGGKTGSTSDFSLYNPAGSVQLLRNPTGTSNLIFGGNVGIGTAIPNSFNSAADNLVVGTTSGDNGITIATGASNQGSLFFADGTSGGAQQAAGYMIYVHTSDYMALGTANTERMRIDSSGNLGLGITPSAWTTYKALDIGTIGNSISGGVSSTLLTLTTNAYFNGSWRYANTATGATLYQMTGGNYYWYNNNTSGTAGNAITLTQAMTLHASGGLSIGNSTDPSANNVLLGNSSATGAINFNALNSSGQSSFGTQGNSAYGALAAGDAYVYTAKHVVLASDSASGAIKFATGAGIPERMRIASNGIITMSAYGAGAATFSASGVISSVSDETWKIKDGAPLNPDVMLQKLKPGYWFYNEEKAPIFGTDRQLGFYAQNVNEAIGEEAAPIPETYTEIDENGVETTHTKPWGYYDRSVLAVTVMSLQKALIMIEEQQAMIDELKAKVAALEAK